MVIGEISRNQVMMHMTFDEEEVEFLSTVLYDALERGYVIMDFFDYKDEPWEDGWE